MNALRERVRALERALGDHTDVAFGLDATLDADEREAFPAAAWERLVAIGFFRELVPSADGGALEDAERLLALGKCIARRDVTLAIALGQCVLGALPVFIAGDDRQRRFVADALLRGEPGALALTERAHGSDLAATATRAVQHDGGYVVSGEKWSINNGTRARYLSVLARTDAAGGPRGFSILLLDTQALGDASETLPKIRTLGIRGADISGRRFVGTTAPADTRVGKSGHGLDLVQRTMHVSRTLVSAFSLGGAETALRAALGFASARTLYGEPVLAIPTVRDALTDAFVAFYVADLVAHAGTRALSIAPEQASISSAITKTYVPEEAIAIVDRATAVLGARHYLRDGAHAIVQKIVCDVRLVPLFDGSAAVNRSVLAAEWPRVAMTTLDDAASGDAARRVQACVDIGGAIDAIGFDRLRATSRGACDAFQALPSLAARVSGQGSELDAITMRALAAYDRLRTIGASSEHRALSHKTARAHALADAFAHVVVLALLLARHALADAEERALILAGLRYVLRRVEQGSPLDDDRATETDPAVFDILVARGASGRAFGVLDVALEEGAPRWHAC